ncbi:hypothetical protein [Streptomyces sp. NPDC003719]
MDAKSLLSARLPACLSPSGVVGRKVHGVPAVGGHAFLGPFLQQVRGPWHPVGALSAAVSEDLEAAVAGYELLRLVGADLLRLLRPGTGKRRRSREDRGGQPSIEG